jgi:hypothetical protein
LNHISDRYPRAVPAYTLFDSTQQWQIASSSRTSTVTCTIQHKAAKANILGKRIKESGIEVEQQTSTCKDGITKFLSHETDNFDAVELAVFDWILSINPNPTLQ